MTNVSTINWANISPSPSSPVSMLLVDIVQDNFLSQLVSEPTRDKNILDLVLTTSTDYVQDLCVGDLFSDHNLITFSINCMPYIPKPSKHEFYCYEKADWNKLCNLLDIVPWNFSLQEVDTNGKWQMWKDLLMSAVDDCIPKVSGKKKTNPPWTTHELISLCRKKKAAYKKARKSGKIRDKLYYSKLNSLVKRKCNSARWEYINNLARNITSEQSKQFWKYINARRKGTNDLVLLKTQDGEITEDFEIAEYMNNYNFSSTFTDEKFENFPTFNKMTSENLTKVECSIDEVECYLNKLDTNKSPGPDNISPHILKRCSKQLAPSLTSLFNDFFATGTLPQDWKIANISPIHKRNSKFHKENYRQISLTSIISKIAEKIVRDRCVQFWSDHQVFCDQQFGFRRNKINLLYLNFCYVSMIGPNLEITATPPTSYF